MSGFFIIFVYQSIIHIMVTNEQKKQIQDKIRSSVVKEIRTAGSVRYRGKQSLDVFLQGADASEAQRRIRDAFFEASIELKVPIEEIKIMKSRYGSYLTATRLETDEELEKRIQTNIKYEIESLRSAHEYKLRMANYKQRQIKKLEEELLKLKS
jgi:hypothetical protein